MARTEPPHTLWRDPALCWRSQRFWGATDQLRFLEVAQVGNSGVHRRSPRRGEDGPPQGQKRALLNREECCIFPTAKYVLVATQAIWSPMIASLAQAPLHTPAVAWSDLSLVVAPPGSLKSCGRFMRVFASAGPCGAHCTGSRTVREEATGTSGIRLSKRKDISCSYTFSRASLTLVVATDLDRGLCFRLPTRQLGQASGHQGWAHGTGSHFPRFQRPSAVVTCHAWRTTCRPLTGADAFRLSALVAGTSAG